MSTKALEENVRCGAIVDIRSDGVRLAVVLSDSSVPHPKILWSHFEALSKAKQGETGILNSLRQAFKKMETTGRKALSKIMPNLTPETIKVSVAAPLSETVARGFKFPPGVSVDIKTRAKELKKYQYRTAIPAGLVDRLDLDVTPGSFINVNGSLYQFITLSRGSIKRELESLRDRVYPQAELDMESFIAGCFFAINELPHQTTDICIVDLSPHATELHIVEGGRPLRSHYLDTGLSDLLEEASSRLQLTPLEVRHLFSDNDVDIKTGLSETQREDWDRVTSDFENRLRGLLRRSDAEKLPPTIFLLVDQDYWGFAKSKLAKASEPLVEQGSILPFSKEVFGLNDEEDPIILLNAHIFHCKYR